jgi:2'-5' RNA ligase
MNAVARMRLGVALLLPPPVSHEVDGMRRALGDHSLGRAPAHVTLIPPVNIRADEIGRVLALLRAAAAVTPRRLDLTLGPPRTFLPVNAVGYLPVGGQVDVVTALRARLLAPPLARPPAWPFVPHVTIADDATPDRLAAAVTALADYRAEVTIERVHTMAEVRGPDGPRWQPLADVAFGRPAVVARAGPLAVELVRSQSLDPEGLALVGAEGIDLDRLLTEETGADLTRDRTLVVTARREGSVVGVAGAWMAPGGCRSAVLVATGHRGQGIGRYLESALASAVDDAGWGCPRLGPVSALDYSKRTAE